ncbi:hypothetical protein BC829DRAFT_259713 [Chytridium lagenaria]|nr:hypothetical protein BC829DRAFT_259713 [Chytridium lagenaria]
MSLLLQLFTPEDFPAEAFLRIVYLFTCKNGKCHKQSWKDSFKCYRSQLPEENLFWTSEPDLSQPHVKPTVVSAVSPDPNVAANAAKQHIAENPTKSLTGGLECIPLNAEGKLLGPLMLLNE